MKKFGAKHLVSAVVATATVVSVGCIAMADEIEKTVDEAADAVAVVEETAETEEVQAQEEEDAVIVDTSAVVADETEEVVAEVAEEEAVEAVEDEIVYEVDEEIVSEEADYAVTNGWFQSDYGYWYYYKNGNKLTGWQKIDGKYYYFNSYGEMITGKYYDSDYKAVFIFGYRGDMQTGWIEYDGNWYYCDPKTGKAATGWKQIDGKYYYFYNSTSNPYMFKNGRYTISNETYFFDEKGVMQTGWYKSDYYNGYDEWYYLGSNGKAAKGWRKIENKWYYFNDYSYHPYMYSNTVTSIYDADAGESSYYAFDANGVMQNSGWYKVGQNYEVYSDGELVYEGKEESWFYLGSNGKAATGWKKISNKWYYFSEDYQPYAVSGLIRSTENSSRFFYCDPDTYEMVTNEWRNDSYTYYYGPNESYTYEGNWYYFGSDGIAVRGWKQISNKWYYFGAGNSTDSPYMRKGIQTISDVKYCFGEDGAMRTNGWCWYNDFYYYADSNGALYTNGWKTIGGKTYYFYSSGVMATGYSSVGGKLRYFGSDGVCRNPG